jgi:branched-chain amino acid transport system substrate-binding protein
MRNWTRRDLVKLSGLGVVGLAGCLEDSGGSDGSGGSGGSGDSGGSGGSSGSGESTDGDDTEMETESSSSMSTYTIGMVDALTGSLAPYGERNQRGKDLALAAINEAGIGDGGQLEIVVEDSESANQAGISAAQKLVNQDGVPLLIGAVGSGVSIAIHDSVTRPNGVVQISQNSTSPRLTDSPELNRACPAGAEKWEALANLVSEDGHDTVAATWLNNDYGAGFADTFPNAFDGEVVFNEPHDQGQSSYSGTLTSMASTDASAWLFITYANEFTVMANEAFDQGYNEQVQYYGAESTIADEILANTQEGSFNGMKGVTESAPEEQENYQNFVSQFESEYDASPTVWSAYAYDATVIAALSAAAADEFTAEALTEVVRDVTRPEGTEVSTPGEALGMLNDGASPSEINYQGVSGPVDLDENGDPPGFYRVYGVEEHDYTTIEYISS